MKNEAKKLIMKVVCCLRDANNVMQWCINIIVRNLKNRTTKLGENSPRALRMLY